MSVRNPPRRLACGLVLSALAACGDDSGNSLSVGPPPGEWLKGDLHLHSAHSNDALDNPEAEVIAKAEALGNAPPAFKSLYGDVVAMSNPIYVSFPWGQAAVANRATASTKPAKRGQGWLR